MKFLILLLIPTLSFANWRASETSPAYAQQSVCMEQERAQCFFVEPNTAEIRSLKDVEVDDTSRPIVEEVAPTEVCMQEDEREEVCELRCEAPYELDDKTCVAITGYEKRLEKQFVIDPVKVAAREQAQQQAAQKEQACEAFRNAVRGMALSDTPSQAAMGTALRNMLGMIQNCN